MRYDDDDDRSRRRRDDSDYDDGPRRRPVEESNGMATTALVLGILSLFCMAFTGLPAIIFGVLGIMKAARTGGSGKGSAVAGLILGVIGMVAVTGGAIWFTIKAIEATNKAFQNTVQQITTIQSTLEVTANEQKSASVAVANRDYESNVGVCPNPYGTMPVAGVALPKGKEPEQPRLSWRVDLLPYLNESMLHQRFQTDEAWDSVSNKPLGRQRVEQYVASYDPPTTADTRWRGFTGPGTVFEPGRKISLNTIEDGTSTTILFAESSELVTWTAPNDYAFSNPFNPGPLRKGEKTHPLPTLGKPNADGFIVAMCDGSVRYVKKSISPDTLNRLIIRNDGLALPTGWDDRPEVAPNGK